MAVKKNWKAEEVTIACKAYCCATLDSAKGSDQKMEVFIATLLQKLEQLAPNDAPDGTYHHRGDRCYYYLRDSVFPEIQKFNKAVRIVENSKPTGVDKKQKLNMAVAIHLAKTRQMNYDFKDFDSSQWKYIGGYMSLQLLPKFAPFQSKSCDSTEDDETTPSSSDHDSDATPKSPTTNYILNQVAAKGERRGVKAAKKHQAKENTKMKEAKRKREREEVRDKKMSMLVSSIDDIKATIREKHQLNLLTRALANNPSPEFKKKIEEKLFSMTERLLGDE